MPKPRRAEAVPNSSAIFDRGFHGWDGWGTGRPVFPIFAAFLFQAMGFVTGSRIAPRVGNHGWTRMDTDREATTKHTKGTKGIEVSRLDLL